MGSENSESEQLPLGHLVWPLCSAVRGVWVCAHLHSLPVRCLSLEERMPKDPRELSPLGTRFGGWGRGKDGGNPSSQRRRDRDVCVPRWGG